MKVFRITPRRIKRVNGQVLTPDMEINVTTRSHTYDPFYNGARRFKSNICECMASTTKNLAAQKVILILKFLYIAISLSHEGMMLIRYCSAHR